MQPRRAAIYGGTFDPVHNGHLKVARGVQKLFELDEVLLIPACVPPHKRSAGITSAFHRFAMLALATEHDESLTISTVELDQPDRPYAVDTVARMQQMLGSDCRLFFVMGADSWAEITTWREWQRLLTMCDHIAVARPGYDLLAHEGPSLTACEPGSLDERIRTALHAASEKKAIDLTVLDLRGVVTFTDFFIISTGANQQQMQAITDEGGDQL